MAQTVFNRALSTASADTPSDLFIAAIPDYTKNIKAEDHPFFSAIKEGEPRSAANSTIKWLVQGTMAVDDTLVTGINDSTTTVEPTNIGYYQIGHVIKMDTELMWVSAVGASTLTVVRGFAGTTAAAHVNTALLNGIRIVGIAVPENFESPRGPFDQGEVDYNYFQLWDSMRQVSDRMDVIKTYEHRGRSRMQEEMDILLKRKFPTYAEQTLIHSLRSAGSGNSTASTMGGLFQTSFNATNVAAAGNALTQFQLLETMQTLYLLVGNDMAKDIWGHPFYGRIWGTFGNDKRQLGANDVKIGTTINEIATDFGTVRFHPNRHMRSVANPALPDGRLLFADLDDYRLIPFSDDPRHKWGVWKVYEGGAYKRRTVRGDYSLEAKYPEKRAVISGLATDAASYPLLTAA